MVYNYNEEGIHRDATGWEQCISVPLVQPDMFELLQQWDHLLEEFSMGEEWLPHRYVAENVNVIGVSYDDKLGYSVLDPSAPSNTSLITKQSKLFQIVLKLSDLAKQKEPMFLST